MDHIKVPSPLRYTLQQHDVARGPILATIIQAKRLVACGHKPGSRNRIPTCKQGYVVPLANQFLSKIRNDPFGPSITLRGHTLRERRYLCDSHIVPLLPAAIRGSLRAAKAECAFISKSGVRTTVINSMIYSFLGLPLVSRSQVIFSWLKSLQLPL